MVKLLPVLDLLAHNAIAALIATVALLALTQITVLIILRALTKVLSFKTFEGIAVEDRLAFRKDLQRRAIRFSIVMSLLLLAGAVVASYRGVRARDEVTAGVTWVRAQDFTWLRSCLLRVTGVLIGAVVAQSLAGALVSVIGNVLVRWKRLEAHRASLPEIIDRLRAATRVLIICWSIKLIVSIAEVPTSVERPITLVVYVTAAFYVSRFATQALHLVADVVLGMSSALDKLQSPLKALSNLKSLTGVTKRAGDYLVYVGAATWVAGQVAADAWYYSAGQVALRLIIIFYASRVLVEMCILLVQEIFVGKPEDHSAADLQRRRTLLPVMMGLFRYGIYFMALIMSLKEASIDPTPLLAGAGVLGVAIGFGAQTFVGDIVAGFFILFEDLVLVGDLVEIGGIKGLVEEIGVRITRIRDDNGVLHAIPNGEVRKVSNHSREYVYAVVDVYAPYEEDPRRVRALLGTTAEALLDEEAVKPRDVEIKVQELSEAAVLFRIVAKVPPGRDEDIGDRLRARVVEELRMAKIGAPRPRRAVIVDSALRVTTPIAEAEAEEPVAPRDPFKPAEAED